MIRDRTLAHMKFEPPESPYSFVAMVPQDVTERLLVEELRRKGGNVEYDTKFIAAEQDDHGVNVTIERRGESTEVRAAVVVGCDGAHSTVRHQLNLPFEGAEYQASFLLADVDTNTRVPCRRDATVPERVWTGSDLSNERHVKADCSDSRKRRRRRPTA